MEWTFLWMMVVLKIPVVAAIWLVWWAMKAEPEPEPEPEPSGEDEGGSKVPEPEPPHRPRRPPPHRRGPHGEPEPPAPPRVRTPAIGRSHSLDV